MMSKETIKQFLKPDWRKILLFTLFALSSLFIGGLACGGGDIGIVCNFWVGFPMPIFDCPVELFEDQLITFAIFSGDCHILSVLPLIVFLFIDIIFWYALSCLIIFAYDKFRGK